MNLQELQNLVTMLDGKDYDPTDRLERRSVGSILNEVLFHAEHRFWHFTPTHFSSPQFQDRLLSFLSNEGLEQSDVATLLEAISHLQFLDRDDLLMLYRAAFTGPISRWLVEQLELRFGRDTSSFERQFNKGVKDTWFCGVTDSFDTGQFCHVNRLPGRQLRPEWLTLSKFGDPTKITSFLRKNAIRRLVLLEDFVGTGTQSSKVVHFAGNCLLPDFPVLFVPLVISEFGLERLRDKLAKFPSVRVEPVFILPKSVHVVSEQQGNEMPFFRKLRSIARRTFEQVKQPLLREEKDLSSEFGFGDVGTMIVLCTNCPNNTLPLIWHTAPRWVAVFPRVSRY